MAVEANAFFALYAISEHIPVVDPLTLSLCSSFLANISWISHSFSLKQNFCFVFVLIVAIL